MKWLGAYIYMHAHQSPKGTRERDKETTRLVCVYIIEQESADERSSREKGC